MAVAPSASDRAPAAAASPADLLGPETMRTLMAAVKASAFLKPQDVPFLKASDARFSEALKTTARDLTQLTQALVGMVGDAGLLPTAAAAAGLRRGASDLALDLDRRFSPVVVDAVDALLERADDLIDQARARQTPVSAAPAIGQNAPLVLDVQLANDHKDAGAGAPRTTSVTIVHGKNVPRPQLAFTEPVDNSNTPFVPKLTTKPNAKEPLEVTFTKIEQAMAIVEQRERAHRAALSSAAAAAATASGGAVKASATTSLAPQEGSTALEGGAALRALDDTETGELLQTNPYAYEITHIAYGPNVLEERDEQPPLPLEDAPKAVWVDTPAALAAMLAELKQVDELAVDLEHHDYRSFQGFTCLMQISTRTQDYLVDTLALRSQLGCLNEVFTNDRIVKVFHGAHFDIQWLQKDLGLYVVNLFDTYHASQVLKMDQHSLAYLLQTYCDVQTNKMYQTADWRIRPLTEEMAKYAQMDTHFLLYIFDRMRNELIARSDNAETKNLLFTTLRRSEAVSLQTYQKDLYDREDGMGNNGWRATARRIGMAFTTEQFAVFKVLHAWRDAIAREEDESVRWVLPNHMLAVLTARMPDHATAVMACCRPVPPLIKIHANELALMIEQARLQARADEAAKTAELEAMQAEWKRDQDRWKAAKAAGPKHIRFDEGDGVDEGDDTADVTDLAADAAVDADAVGGGDALSTATPADPEFRFAPAAAARLQVTMAAPLSSASLSSFHMMTNAPAAAAATAAAVTAASDAWILLPSPVGGDAQRKAEAVRATLYLEAPTLDTEAVAAMDAAAEAAAAAAAAEAQAEADKKAAQTAQTAADASETASAAAAAAAQENTLTFTPVHDDDGFAFLPAKKEKAAPRKRKAPAADEASTPFKPHAYTKKPKQEERRP